MSKQRVKWEVSQGYKQRFLSSASMPYRRQEREEIAAKMTFGQLKLSGEFQENPEMRRKQRWKELKNLWSTTLLPEYSRGRIENALWRNNDLPISAEYFVMCMMHEYRFENRLGYDKHLLWLYWTFDGGRDKNEVDWRDILASFQIIKYFRLINGRTLDLMLLLFNIYSIGDKDGKNIDKLDFVLENAKIYITRMFLLPCITQSQICCMDLLLVDLLQDIELTIGRNITRRKFEQMLSSYDARLLETWSRYAWELMPTELRLTYYDEVQMQHHDSADFVLMRHKWTQATSTFYKNTTRKFYKAWKLVMLRESGVRRHLHMKLVRRRQRFFRFWMCYMTTKKVRRRRRMLAEVIGTYAIKARCFARIKLFNYNHRRLLITVGSFDKSARLQKLAGTHLREFRRMFRLRRFYHRWWEKVRLMINLELTAKHDRERRMRGVFTPWRTYAHMCAVEKRMEAVTLENKLNFDRKMAEAEENMRELKRLEAERDERIRLAEEQRAKEEKVRRLEEARKRVQKDREKDRKLVVDMQRDSRIRRVKNELKAMKAKFKKEWEVKTADMLEKAKRGITAYIENKDNQLAIDMKFEATKRAFLAPPVNEKASREREKILSSVKNIMFLYVQAKMRQDLLEMQDLIPQFDKGCKGYLTYSEFTELILSTGTNLTKAQISSTIRGIDTDKDGFVDFAEIDVAMKETDSMGVVGSDWKMYIDPAENVMCYHNFATGEKIFDYKITDKKLREITIANMYGEADHQAVLQVHKQKKEEWELTLQNYMARRMQFMFRQWRARRWRAKKVWKIEKKKIKARTDLQKRCVKFLESTFIGWKCREAFKKQLRLTIEKVWDVDSRLVFWYNHATQISTWEMPLLLRRYGDVMTPTPWVPIVIPQTDSSATSEGIATITDGAAAGSDYSSALVPASTALVQQQQQQQQQQSRSTIHYWHVTAQKDLPRKPDGLPLCNICQRNLALVSCSHCGNVDYCFGCHRKAHASPLGFFQKAKLTKEQLNNTVFLERLSASKHIWQAAKPLRCQLCKSGEICAGVHCTTCNMDYCRPCNRRVHAMEARARHEQYCI